MKAMNIPHNPEMENKYEWTPYINLHFKQFVNEAQPLSYSAFPAPHLWLDFPSKTLWL